MQDGHGIHLLDWDSVCRPISEGGLGIQSLIVRREALITRHASRFLLDPGCLWSLVMRAKYGDWSDMSPSQSTCSYSFFWKEVCRRAPAVLRRTSWMIGDGHSVNVLSDIWLAELPLIRWPTYVSSDIPIGLRVSDLITQDQKAWNGPLVASLFGMELSQRIFSIPLIPDQTEDIRLWRRSCLTRAPIRDIMQECRTETGHTLDGAWIWQLSIHPRVCLFIWKMAWDRLPTCSLLSGRGMAISPFCPVCGTEEETVSHAIFTCYRARLIWQAAGYLRGVGSTVGSTVQGGTSFLTMIRQDMRRGFGRSSSLAAYIAYQIWLSRNRHIFSDISESPHRVVRSAQLLSEEYIVHHSAIDSDSTSYWGSPAALAAHRNTVFISWEPPPLGFVKVNFDGSVRDRQVGSAFVIRGSDGELLAAGGLGLLDLSVPAAELHAAWVGISHAIRSLGSRRLIIEGDSITIVRWLRQDLGGPPLTNPMICDIRLMLQQADIVQIRHIYREANSAADWVAARVAQHSGSWFWTPGDPLLPTFSQILYFDTLGLSLPRLV